MTQTVEFDLAKFLERIEEKLNKVVESQARLEEKTASLQNGQDAINAKLNIQQTWFLSLLTGLTVGILGLVAAVGKVVFFPNP